MGGLGMRIDITYQGAIAARGTYSRTHIDRANNSLAGKEIDVVRDGQAFKLTFSDELIEFKQDNYDFFSRDINVINADPNDIFSYRPQDQWLIFSQFLHDEGFYQSLSFEETAHIEDLLQQITSGLDSLTRTGIKFGKHIEKELSSHEAHLEFASSVAALKHFSHKYLEDDLKAGFDQLVEKYIAHNTEKVMNHRSLEERFISARSKIKPLNASLTQEEKLELAISNKIGAMKLTKEDFNQIVSLYKKMFESIGEEIELNSIIEVVKEEFLSHVTKEIGRNDYLYNGIVNYFEDMTSDTFQRLTSYWQDMLK